MPVRDIAEGLLALEAIIKQSPAVLESLFPGTQIDSVEVFINELKSGSIWEEVVIKFIFGNQKTLDQFITNLREKAGMDCIMSNPLLFSAILLTMILMGGAYYTGKQDNDKDTDHRKITIEDNSTTIIHIGAQMVGMEADEFKGIIESAIKDKKQLAKNAIGIVRPAKRDELAAISFNRNEDLRITPETVRAMPRYYEEQEQEETLEDFKNIYMEIRATDLDSQKTGWAVIIPDLGDKRTRLQLDPSLNPEEILEKRKFNGNVTVKFKYDKDNNKIPSLVFLREINN